MTTSNNAILLFRLNDQLYGLSIDYIEVIVPIMAVQRVPQMPDDWFGVANIRGMVTPIVDLRIRFEMPSIIPKLSAPVIVLKSDNHQVALLVDYVDQILYQPSTLNSTEGQAPIKLHNGKVMVALDAHALINETPLPTQQY
jgi:purine-binding chemotaxis protein CheW